MAEFNKKTGNIDLSVDDQEMFKEVGSHFTPNGFRNSKWVSDIMKWLNGEPKYPSNFISEQEEETNGI